MSFLSSSVLLCDVLLIDTVWAVKLLPRERFSELWVFNGVSCSSSSSDDDEPDESEEDTFSYDASSIIRLSMVVLPPPSSFLEGDTRSAPGSWVSIFITLGGADPVLDATASSERAAWSKNRTRFLSSEDVDETLLVVDVDVTLVEAGNDKLWQDFSSDCNDFSDWQGFSSATGGESFGTTMFLLLILEWLGVFLVRSGLLIFLFVVVLVDVVLFESPMIDRDEPVGCWKK